MAQVSRVNLLYLFVLANDSRFNPRHEVTWIKTIVR
jgi:hypothetical protein